MKYLFSYLLFWLAAAAALKGQPLQVWPGDANNNGIVNNVDLLQIGLAYNNFGPERATPSSIWQAHPATPWSLVAGNGVNMAYTDANGDGLVHYYYDAFPVYVHYGLTHGAVTPDPYPAGVPGVDAPLFFDTFNSPIQVFGGAVLHLPLVLGTPSIPAEDLYGLAFSLHVDPAFIDVDDVTVNLDPTSWANPDNDRVYATYPVSDTRLDVGWVRTDHNERSGSGAVGIVSFIIIDDVVSLEENFQIRIDSIHYIDRFGNTTAVAGDTLQITLLPDALTSTSRPDTWNPPRAWPNPAHDRLELRAASTIRVATLSDALGRVAARLEPGKPWIEWPLPALPPGIYWLDLATDNQVFRQKIVIQ